MKDLLYPFAMQAILFSSLRAFLDYFLNILHGRRTKNDAAAVSQGEKLTNEDSHVVPNETYGASEYSKDVLLCVLNAAGFLLLGYSYILLYSAFFMRESKGVPFVDQLLDTNAAFRLTAFWGMLMLVGSILVEKFHDRMNFVCKDCVKHKSECFQEAHLKTKTERGE